MGSGEFGGVGVREGEEGDCCWSVAESGRVSCHVLSGGIGVVGGSRAGTVGWACKNQLLHSTRSRMPRESPVPEMAIESSLLREGLPSALRDHVDTTGSKLKAGATDVPL